MSAIVLPWGFEPSIFLISWLPAGDDPLIAKTSLLSPAKASVPEAPPRYRTWFSTAVWATARATEESVGPVMILAPAAMSVLASDVPVDGDPVSSPFMILIGWPATAIVPLVR